jgi:hypothetical protein
MIRFFWKYIALVMIFRGKFEYHVLFTPIALDRAYVVRLRSGQGPAGRGFTSGTPLRNEKEIDISGTL